MIDTEFEGTPKLLQKVNRYENYIGRSFSDYTVVPSGDGRF